MKDIQDRGSIPLGSTSTVSGVVRTHGVDKTRIGVKRSTANGPTKPERRCKSFLTFFGDEQVSIGWSKERSMTKKIARLRKNAIKQELPTADLPSLLKRRTNRN